jgi:hypothetical protein
MRKLVLMGIMVLAMSCVALAEDFPKFEVFGGYSYLRTDLNNNQPASFSGGLFKSFNLGSAGLHGYDVSVAYNLNSWVGLKVDFSGNFGKQYFDGFTDMLKVDTDYTGGTAGTPTNYRTFPGQSGQMKFRQYNVLFGPEFSYRKAAKVRPFAHVLFGLTKSSAKNIDINYVEPIVAPGGGSVYDYVQISGFFKNTAPAIALGGGLDIKATSKVSIRLFQFDYIPSFSQIEAPIVMSTTVYENNNPAGNKDIVSSTGGTLRMPTDRFNNMRISAGLVVNF